MSEHAMGLSKIKTQSGYESAWLSRWTRSDTGAKHSKEIKVPEDASYKKKKVPEDGQLLKELTDSMKLKGKMVSKVLDLCPNSDSADRSVAIIPDMNKEPPIVADREDLIGEHEGETSRSATQSKNVELFLNNTSTKMLSGCKRIWSDSETNCRSQAKRLKTNTSDYIGGETKSMMVVEEGPSGNNVNYYFHRVMVVEEGPSGNNVNYYFHRVFRINKPTSQIKNLNLNMGGVQDVNPWIKRWCTTKAAETHEPRGEEVNPEGTALEKQFQTQEPRGEEVNPEGTALEKQFPSVAAMALMGKAMSGFKPSGLIKTNSLFIWNAHEQRRKL